MPKTLYLDCFAGIAGDMALGALLDLGYSKKLLKMHLAKLPIGPITFKCKKVSKQGLMGTQVLPILPKEDKPHRSLASINKIIRQSTLKPSIKKNVISTFDHLGSAEAKIHGVDIEQVHFHECGAWDTIFDIVGFCAALDDLSIEQILVSPINVGRGFVNCSHGQLPIPAPATISLLKNFSIYSHGPKAELTTPTGAVLLKQFSKPVSSMPEGILKAIGYGSGTKNIKSWPNLLRAILIETSEKIRTSKHVDTDKTVLLKTNIDDLSPEVVSYIQQLLFKNGALDVITLPIQMKKNRLGIQLEVMSKWQDVDHLAEIILKETTSLGLRIEEIKRIKLKRTIKTLIYQGHPIKIKYAYWGKQLINIKPEYNDIERFAKKHHQPIISVINNVKKML